MGKFRYYNGESILTIADVFSRAFSVVSQNAAVALSQPSLLETGYSLLVEVIKSDTLKIEEIDLFQKVQVTPSYLTLSGTYVVQSSQM